MLCLDLPHLEVKFKIVKELTFRSKKKDRRGHRVRAQENRGPEGYRGWEVWIPLSSPWPPPGKDQDRRVFFLGERKSLPHKFYPSSNPREEAIYGLSLLLVLILGVCFSKVLVIIARPGTG